MQLNIFFQDMLPKLEGRVEHFVTMVLNQLTVENAFYTNDSSDHDCRQNYAGSATSMKSAIAVDLVSNIMEL